MEVQVIEKKEYLNWKNELSYSVKGIVAYTHVSFPVSKLEFDYFEIGRKYSFSATALLRPEERTERTVFGD